MTKITFDSKPNNLNKIIIGTATNKSEKENFELWDYWYNNGVKTFDTSFHYNDGYQEKYLGKWIQKNNLKDIIIISKNTFDKNISNSIEKLKISMERLNVTKLDYFLFHRTIEFIDIKKYLEICENMKSLKIINKFGFSNISYQKTIDLVNIYKGEQELYISNNLSYAKMFTPPWEGVISCNDDKFIKILINHKITNFSWSSQAMGFFYNKINKHHLISKLYYKCINKKKEIRAFLNRLNSQKFKKIKKLSIIKNEKIENLPLAWVLNQAFPSFAITNANNTSQIDSIIDSTKINFNDEEINILNN